MIFKKDNRKDRNAFICNLIITILVIIGIVFKYCIDKYLVDKSIEQNDWTNLKFFTNQSNIMMGIVSLIYLIYLVCKAKGKVKDIPTALSAIKLFATSYVVLTGIITQLVLTPGSLFKVTGSYPTYSLYIGSNLLFHVIVPALSCVTWLLFENTKKIKMKYIWFVFIYFGLYVIFYLVMAYTHVNADGTIAKGYDWYTFCHFGPVVALIICVLMFAGMFGITFGLWQANRHIEIKYKKTQGK